MNKQITIGGESMSFQDFAGKYLEFLRKNTTVREFDLFWAAGNLEVFLHTYTKKS